MPSIIFDDASVDFPVFGAAARSLRGRIVKLGVGGIVGVSPHNVVHVQALQDISFEAQCGDRIALVGRNGAGKSTLLRVIAGVYEPSTGNALVQGRIASLFDASLGMSLDSTGYENILLRGIYLGLSPSEIRGKTTEIADFTELGDYLSMPLRTYSTGMRTRLAFAVSTCFEPDVLLLDEGFGSGDMAFIDKAERRLEAFFDKSGIAVLASHSEALVRKFCNRALLLDAGKLVAAGSVDEIFESYRGLAGS